MLHRLLPLVLSPLALSPLAAADIPVWRVSQGEHALHYYFDQSPESPDGTRVVYSRLSAAEDATEVVLCARDGSAARTLGRIAGRNTHLGAKAIWIDDDTVAWADAQQEVVRLLRLSDGALREHPGGIDEYSPANQKILYTIPRPTARLAAGVYTLDVRSGSSVRLVEMPAMTAFAAAMGRPATSLWHFDHACWSPDGTRFIFEIKTQQKSVIDADYLFHAQADGSAVTLVGLKPMHPHWWDDDTVFGHDWQGRKDHLLRRWRLDGTPVADLAGAGCHGTVSPDRRWAATESWYDADPIDLRLFRIGETSPAATVFSQPRMVRGQDFWALRTHVHPAFSTDGRRLYFNAWPATEPGPQLWCADLSAIVGSGS